MRNAWLWVRTFAVAVTLNFVWEMAQASLYEPMGTFWQATRRCFVANPGDGVLILLVVAAGSAVFKSPRWFVAPKTARLLFATAAGMVLALAIEWWGLRSGRWQYNPLMPMLPGTQFGLVPLAQMAILTPLTLRIASVWACRVVR